MSVTKFLYTKTFQMEETGFERYLQKKEHKQLEKTFQNQEIFQQLLLLAWLWQRKQPILRWFTLLQKFGKVCPERR